MNTILLQKILDILTEGLAHVGDFFKDLFVSDPQDGQVIGYDAEAGKWKNIDLAELSFELTNKAGPFDIITLTDAAENVPMNSLIVDIVPKQASGTPTPESPLPISGFTGANITHTGVNIWDEETELGSIDASGNLIPSNNTLRSKNAIRVLPNTTYYFLSGGSNGYVYGYDADGNFSGWGSGQVNNNTFTTGATTYYIRFRMASAYGTTYLNNMGIMSDTSQTTYVAYTATIIPISWQTEAGTVYGGWYDVTTGKLRAYIYYASYNGETLTGKWVSSMDTYVAGTTPTIGAQVVDLSGASYTEYTLTPTQIKTRGGTESIFADCGDVEGEYYTTTAGIIIDLVSITEDITSEVTVNTTDWSSVQYKVVKNNNVVTIYLYSATTTEHGSVELFSGLPKAAYNGPVLLYDTDNSAVVNAKVDTSGYVDVTMSAGGTVKGTITYVAK